MTRSCFVIAIAVCCLLVTPDFGATEECSVGRGGVLTMFNGQTSTVAVPCKYRLAFFQCGDYKVRVTPGSKLDSNNLFSPTTVRLSIKRISTNEKVAVRTSIRRWQKYLAGNGRVTNPWKVRTNDFETFGLDLAGADTANTAAYLRKNDSFEVVFNANQASVVVRCFNDSFTPALDPDTLCGDGEAGPAPSEAELLPIIFNNFRVKQDRRSSCHEVVRQFRYCDGGSSTTTSCDHILLNQNVVGCLAGSDPSMADYYLECLMHNCNGRMLHVNSDCFLDTGSACSVSGVLRCGPTSTCDAGGTCKLNVGASCATVNDQCIEGSTCDNATQTCLLMEGESCAAPNQDFCETGVICVDDTCTRSDGCGGNITGAEAIISSPHFPETYDNSEHCVWHFAPPMASTDQIKVKFLNFSLEYYHSCGYDSVTIFDNLANSIELIGRYCGHSLPSTVTAMGRALTVEFFSDTAVTYTGFQLKLFTCPAPVCPDACPYTGVISLDSTTDCEVCWCT